MTGKGGIGLLHSSHPFMSRLPTLLFRYWNRAGCWEFFIGFDLRRDRGVTEVVDDNGARQRRPDSRVQTSAQAAVTPLFIDSTQVYAGAGHHRLLVDRRRLSLTIGGRGIVQLTSAESTPRANDSNLSPTLSSALSLLIEVPLQVEYFLTDHSAISASVSASASVSESFAVASKDDGGLQDLMGVLSSGRGGVSLSLGGGFSGGLGYTYYF